jgi:hypothetical protein
VPGNITCALVTPTRFEFNDDNDDVWVYKETWNLANQLAIALTDCRHRKYICTRMYFWQNEREREAVNGHRMSG